MVKEMSTNINLSITFIREVDFGFVFHNPTTTRLTVRPGPGVDSRPAGRRQSNTVTVFAIWPALDTGDHADQKPCF